MSFSRPIQWYYSHVDPIWPDGTFKKTTIFLAADVFTEILLYYEAGNLATRGPHSVWVTAISQSAYYLYCTACPG
jgi:hypothetical protein